MAWHQATGVLAQAHFSDGTGSYPLILLVLAVSWLVFGAAVVWTVWSSLPEGRRARAAVLGVGAVLGLGALGLALAVSPGPPVLCTYTGLSHITSAFRIAALEWNWTFPSDYPLTVPLFAAPFVSALGNVPEAFGVANSVLFALGVVGGFFLALELFGALAPAALAGGILVTSPLLLLFAGGDSLSMGYFALSGWVFLLALRHVAPARGSSSSWWSAAGLTAAFILICQTRLEALAFPVVAGIGALLIRSGAGDWKQKLGRLLLPGGAALLFMAPYLARFYSNLIATDRVSQELGTRHVWILMAAAGISCIAAFSYGRRLAGQAAWQRLVPGLTLVLLFAGACLAWYAPGFFSAGTVCAGDDCLGQTFATVLFWHLNPKLTAGVLVGATLMGLAAPGLLGRPGLWSALVVWIAVVVSAASVKATGELLFEGARTQLPASIPFALLAVAGLQALFHGWKNDWRLVTAGMGLAAVCLPLVLPNAVSLGYDEQQEFELFRNCLSDLPARAAVYAPDDSVEFVAPGDIDPVRVELYPLFRTGYLAESLQGEGDRVRMAPYRALEEQAGDNPDGEQRYFFFNLNCYRTGRHELNPSCREVKERFRLEPVCEATVDNRPYTSDYFDRIHSTFENMRLGIYRLVPMQAEVVDAIP